MLNKSFCLSEEYIFINVMTEEFNNQHHQYQDTYRGWSACCAERRSTAQYGGDLVTWCNVSNVCNMSAKNNSDSEYYGRFLVTWCNVCNMSAKNNSDSEYYGRDIVTWCNVCKVCNIEVTKVKLIYYIKLQI